jgi:branched-chain amino acid transport system ATP-binding protein
VAGAGAGQHREGPRPARRFKLDAKKDDFAGTLSGGQRKLLEMAAR